MGNIFVVISYYKSTQPNVIPVTLSSHLSVVNKPFGTQHNCVCVVVGGCRCLLREPSLQKLGPPKCPGLNFVE